MGCSSQKPVERFLDLRLIDSRSVPWGCHDPLWIIYYWAKRVVDKYTVLRPVGLEVVWHFCLGMRARVKVNSKRNMKDSSSVQVFVFFVIF